MGKSIAQADSRKLLPDILPVLTLALTRCQARIKYTLRGVGARKYLPAADAGFSYRQHFVCSAYTHCPYNFLESCFPLVSHATSLAHYPQSVPSGQRGYGVVRSLTFARIRWTKWRTTLSCLSQGAQVEVRLCCPSLTIANSMFCP